MWAEPLTAHTDDAETNHVRVAVIDQAGTLCAHVRVAIDRVGQSAIYGSMIIDDRNGGPRQTRRAMVLMVREALRYAAARGCQHAHTRTPGGQIAIFAQRMFGIDGEIVANQLVLQRELADVRTNVLAISDADGND